MTNRRHLMAGAALLALGACVEPIDLDMRNLGNGFDTTQAAQSVGSRPAPDSRGVISYPNYQVAVARRGDTVTTVASRLGIDANSLASYNGLTAATPLRRDEVLALPARVAEPAGTATSSPIQAPGVSVRDLASNAIDRAEAGQPAAATPAPAPSAGQSGFEPIRHQVQPGETVYTIARNYDVPVRSIAEWNGLGPDLTVRQGQYLMIPMASGQTRTPTPASVNAPGTGSATPVPPSASTPLPDENPTATAPQAQPAATAPVEADIGEAPAPASNARFRMPVSGSIIRDYARGRNEGIDIAAPAGTAVQAAGAGTVAAITENTDGAAIVVIRHSDNLLTVYVNLTDVSVAKGASVSAGQTIARIPAGDPSFLHFEVREGLESVDPNNYLP